MKKIKIKSFNQFLNENKEKDESPEAIFIASEVDLLDKAEKNTKATGKEVKDVDKRRKELIDQYKEVTGHDNTSKSIDESISVYEGLLEDLGLKDFKEFGRQYAAQIKKLVEEIGGTYIGYTYDPPTKTIAITTDKGIGKYYFDQESQEFDQYQVQAFYK